MGWSLTKVGENNGQLRFIRHHGWRTQARLDQFSDKHQPEVELIKISNISHHINTDNRYIAVQFSNEDASVTVLVQDWSAMKVLAQDWSAMTVHVQDLSAVTVLHKIGKL